MDALRDYGAYALALSPRRDRLPAELPDNVGGARSATEHLIELGHQRIAYIDGPAGLFASQERFAGYREALAAAGIDFDDGLVERGEYSVAGGQDALKTLMDRGRDFTAVFASNDAMAIGCVKELRRRGLAIPTDMSLVGFDDIPLVSALDPPLTTVSVPMAEIGAAAMRRLIGLLAGEPNSTLDAGGRSGRGRLVNMHKTELVVRASTAAPRREADRPRPARRRPGRQPRTRLATLPTALERGPELGGGARLYVKRDDLSGLGLGGNKARKLEFLCAPALSSRRGHAGHGRRRPVQPCSHDRCSGCQSSGSRHILCSAASPSARRPETSSSHISSARTCTTPAPTTGRS